MRTRRSKKKSARRVKKTHRNRRHYRGGNGTVSLYGINLSENEFKKRVQNGTLYSSVDPLD